MDKDLIRYNFITYYNNFKKILISVWPTIYRIINTFLYFIFSVLKSMVAIAFKQLKQ